MGASATGACQIAFSAVGGVTMALGSAGNPLAILAGAGFGYVIGRIACKHKAFQDFFGRKLEFDQFERTMEEEEVRDPVLSDLGDLLKIDRKQSETALAMIIETLRRTGPAIESTGGYSLSQHHPASGPALHGISLIARAVT